MSLSPLTLSRVSNLMRGNLVSSTVSRTQSSLMEVQQQLTTGKRLAAPSDDAGDAAIAQSVRKLLEQRASYKTNLDAANSNLAETDNALNDVTDLLRQAQDIASANVGSDVTSDARQAAATIVDSIYSQMLTMGNKSVAGTYIFAGDRSTDAPFVEAAGGVKWVGSSTLLSNTYDEGTNRTFMVDGSEVFGALASRVKGDQDLSPSIDLQTRLVDLGGAGANGVTRGVIQIGDGTTSKLLDLGDADTVSDVINRINAAATNVTAALNAAGTGIDLTAGVADTISVKDIGGGSMAADLGISQPVAAAAGAAVNGTNSMPRITPLTKLSSLKGGAGIDLTGLKITNGGVTKSIDLSGATDVESMLNTINNAGVDVKAQINASGTGIDVLNAVQGTPLSISEIGAGTTASDLGVRSFQPTTLLADLNDGRGVGNVDGTDLQLTDSNSVAFEVDFDGATTVQDAIDKINAAATAAGAGVTASFATATNSIVLTDAGGGPGVLTPANLHNSNAVAELGLDTPAVAGVIGGKDVGAVQSQGVFANLIRLRSALRSDDQQEITRAAEMLDADTTRVIRVRGQVGAQVQEFDNRTESLADQNVATKALLSTLEDTDFTDAIIKFQTLQTSLQASMQAAGATLNLSLMDFLH